MPFRVLSWNIETFGETKLKGIDNFVARVIARSNADLVFVLESTMHAQSGLATSISSEMEAITGQSWFGFGSDPTYTGFFRYDPALYVRHLRLAVTCPREHRLRNLLGVSARLGRRSRDREPAGGEVRRLG